MANEVELKLLIDPADIPRLRRHGLLKAHSRGRPRSQHLLSIYYDTPDLSLRQGRMALRVRRSGNRWIQTVKGGGAVQAGLHRRGEWEAEVAHERPDLTKIESPDLLELFTSPEIRDRLEAVFVTEFRRTLWLLEWENGDQVEFVLDQGEVKSGDRSVPLCEVELELKKGQPGRLYQTALELQQDIPLRLEDVSKAERGYRLFQSTEPKVVKAVSPELRPDMTVAKAFQTIAWNCVGHWTANQEGVLVSTEPEFIHQMRVALRRLRSALPLFAPAIGKASYATINGELKWLTDELGPARDLDVFVTQTLPPIRAAFPERSDLAVLETVAEGAREKARENARAALRSDRYNRLLLALGAWLLSDGWHSSIAGEQRANLEEPVAGLARKMLAKRHKTLHGHGHRLAAMPPEERHQVRIAAKKLRYATEFFAALYPGRKNKAYVQALSRLQDELGVLNDAAVTRGLLARLEEKPGSQGCDLCSAVNLVVGWLGRAVVQHLDTMEAAWDEFYEIGAFWRKDS